MRQLTKATMAAILALTLTVGLMPLAAWADEGPQRLAVASESIDDTDYSACSLTLKGVPYNGDYGVLFACGEPMSIKASLTSWDDSTFKNVPVKGVTYRWKKVPSALKAKATGGKLVSKALPAKAKTYKVTLETVKDGVVVRTDKVSIVVKKKANVKVVVNDNTGKTKNYSNPKYIYSQKNAIVYMNNASFGWDSGNKKHPFYAWTVTDLATGKTAKYNYNMGSFAKNDFIGGGSVAGGEGPTLMAIFNKAGKFKITGTIYHNGKSFGSATKTILVRDEPK